MRNSLPSRWIGAFALVAGTAGAQAQCLFTTSMTGVFRETQPVAGQQQNPASGWTFERSGASGTERRLLEGVESSGWTGGSWGSPNQPFLVPLAGPVYSQDPLINQIPFYYRLPSFTGLMLHPGFGADHARAVLAVQQPSTLSMLAARTEDLGQASGGAAIRVLVRRVGGATITLIPETFITSLAPAQTLTPAAGVLPVVLAVGDRVEVETSDAGNAAEDWLSVEVSADLSGPPLVESQPLVHANCGGPFTATVVVAGASSYRWYRDGAPLSDGPTATGSTLSGTGAAQLAIDGFGPADVGRYWCEASNSCGGVTSTAATLTRCFADFNCDGFLDFFDYDDFVGAFETGDPRADFNGDGFQDFFDYDDFVGAFESGC